MTEIKENITKDVRPHKVAASQIYTIRVVDHHGSRTKRFKSPGPVSIGSGSQNDFAVTADGVEDTHLRLVIPEYPADGVRVLPLASNLVIESFGPLAVGQFADVLPGTEIRIGDVSVRVLKGISESRSDRWVARSLPAACVALLIVLTWAWYAGVVSESASPESAELDNSVVSKDVNIGDGNSGSDSFDPEKLEALAWTARTQLEDLGIGDQLVVVPNFNGELSIAGTLASQDDVAWQRFLEWYSTRSGYPPLVQNINQTGSVEDIPELNSIWLDDQPSVIFRSGSIGKVGTEIENGWIVVSISRNAVVIARDGSYVTLKF